MNPNETDFVVREDAEAEATMEPGVPEGFRRLRWDEPVREGDFVMNAQRGFEPWEGPGGFRADMFVKPIYRRGEIRTAEEAEKS